MIRQNQISKLPNAAHVEQMSLVLQTLSESKAEELKLVAQRKNLAELFDKEDLTFKLNKAYLLSPEIKAMDKERDHFFSFIMGIIRANLTHFDTEKKEAAIKLEYITKTYHGTRHKSFVEESSLLHHLLQEFERPDNIAAINILNLKDAIEKLKHTNEQFQQLYVSRFNETEHRKSLENMETIRPQVDKAYKELREAINAAYIYYEQIQKDTAMSMLYQEIIERINAIIDMVEQMKSLSGKKKNSNKENS